MTDAAKPSVSSVQARPSMDPTVRLLIVAAMFIGVGAWCFCEANFAKDDNGNPKYPRPAEPFSVKTINAWAGYITNHGGGYVLPLLGLPFLIGAVRQIRRRMTVDATGITAGREKVAWSDVKEIDAGEMAKKSILKIYHDQGMIKIDGYYWQKSDFRTMVAIIEQNVPAEKIRR